MHSKMDSAAGFAQLLGNAVRAHRERIGLRQDELALTAGVSTRVVHQIENGKPTSRLDSVLPVLDALGLSLAIEDRAGGEAIADVSRRRAAQLLES
jgi:HTH-type transcriptional regulator / antitoxin HipB